MNKKLLIVVGAGASIDFKMPSVYDVGKFLSIMAQKNFRILNREHNLYDDIKQRIDTFWLKNMPAHCRRESHFEDILYVVYSMLSLYPNYCLTSAVASLTEPMTLPNIIVPYKDSSDKTILSIFLQDLIKEIVRNFREKCNNSLSYTNEMKELEKFLKLLLGRFEISIVTLNYDNILYQAIKNIVKTDIITGFNQDGQFEKGLIFDKDPSSPCILHMHGSIHFTRDNNNIIWNENLSQAIKKEEFLFQGNTNSTEGHVYPNSTIIAGYGKTVQILSEPFRTYYSEFDRLVHQSDAVLFAGYGFNDAHINEAFNNYLNKDKNRRVVLIDWVDPKKNYNALGATHDIIPLQEKISHTLKYELINGYSKPSKQTTHFSKDHILQTDARGDSRLAIWYNGMLEACKNANKIIKELE